MHLQQCGREYFPKQLQLYLVHSTSSYHHNTTPRLSLRGRSMAGDFRLLQSMAYSQMNIIWLQNPGEKKDTASAWFTLQGKDHSREANHHIVRNKLRQEGIEEKRGSSQMTANTSRWHLSKCTFRPLQPPDFRPVLPTQRGAETNYPHQPWPNCRLAGRLSSRRCKHSLFSIIPTTFCPSP